MKVYELIKALTAYPPDTDVYFRADGRVSEYNGNKKDQGAVDDMDCFTVDGNVIGVEDWYDQPEIQCTVIY